MTSSAMTSSGMMDSPRPGVGQFLSSVRFGAVVAGVAGTVVSVLGALWSPEYFYPSYLVAFLFWLSLTLGCWVLTMIHWLSGGMWGQVIRRVLMAVLATVPMFAFLFLPIGWIGGAKHIYPWANVPESESTGSEHGVHSSESTANTPPPAPAEGDSTEAGAVKPVGGESPVIAAWRANTRHDHEFAAKQGYLNYDWWCVRAGVVFLLWIILTTILERWSWGDSPRSESIRRQWGYRLAGPSLLIYSLSVLVSSTDWTMSIQPHWYSSMFGVAMMGIHTITGMSFAILASAYLSQWEPWRKLDKPRHWGDLGSLLFTATMFWTYTAFMQYLIIYAGNLPVESSWFVARNNYGWEWVSRLLVVFHFFVPFMCLLMRPIKRDRKLLGGVCVLLIVMQLVEFYWLVFPALYPNDAVPHWTLPFAVIAIGGWWVAIVSSRLLGSYARLIYDPEYEKASHAEPQDHADLSVAG